MSPTLRTSTAMGCRPQSRRPSSPLPPPVVTSRTPVPGRDGTALGRGQPRGRLSIAVTVDEVAQQVLPPLLDLADVADPSTLELHNSSIDLTPFISAAPVLRAADDAVADCEDRINSIDPSNLTGTVRTGWTNCPRSWRPCARSPPPVPG